MLFAKEFWHLIAKLGIIPLILGTSYMIAEATNKGMPIN